MQERYMFSKFFVQRKSLTNLTGKINKERNVHISDHFIGMEMSAHKII